jgi:hypothetical protein
MYRMYGLYRQVLFLDLTCLCVCERNEIVIDVPPANFLANSERPGESKVVVSFAISEFKWFRLATVYRAGTFFFFCIERKAFRIHTAGVVISRIAKKTRVSKFCSLTMCKFARGTSNGQGALLEQRI